MLMKRSHSQPQQSLTVMQAEGNQNYRQKWEWGRTREDEGGGNLHHGGRQAACCVGQTSALLASCLYQSRSVGGREVNRRLTGAVLGWTQWSRTRSLSIAVTRYKLRFLLLWLQSGGGNRGRVCGTRWAEWNANKFHWACKKVSTVCLCFPCC